ncbi:MAG: hypothetical protein ACRDHL_12495 [Candidatus Promineifilaceae bacterium]
MAIVILAALGALAAGAILGAGSAGPPHTVAILQPLELDPTGAQTKFYTFATFEEAMAFVGADPYDYRPQTGQGDSVEGSAPAADSGGAERHCVVRIEPLQPGSGKLESVMSDLACFDSFAAAIEAATGGMVHVAAGLSPAEIDAKTLAAARGTVVIGIDSAGANFGGSSLTWTASHAAGCSDGSFFAAPSMPAGWNDAVSSARSFSGCSTHSHYEHASYGGAILDCGPSCTAMGALDNETSSELWAQ